MDPEKNQDQKPCFGQLDKVFPMQPDGLRKTPEACLACPDKTACLRAAINSAEGVRLHAEKINRAYDSGNMGFWERWLRRKTLKKSAASSRRR